MALYQLSYFRITLFFKELATPSAEGGMALYQLSYFRITL
jgi:hypothetical protein